MTLWRLIVGKSGCSIGNVDNIAQFESSNVHLVMRPNRGNSLVAQLIKMMRVNSDKTYTYLQKNWNADSQFFVEAWSLLKLRDVVQINTILHFECATHILMNELVSLHFIRIQVTVIHMMPKYRFLQQKELATHWLRPRNK